ncbi:ATP-binding protein [Methylobacillus gramineus]|uniref:P-loop ATPase, Sll1717 family n=1 Tax=Methylobacillus gramineus TaxID=755169 RepID=UPI001CFFAB7F|nr:ATP-binding protein [Methylobacillus gramineus]MCB5185211.1 ATP-binding protein [Methylobacillus gramineus]
MQKVVGVRATLLGEQTAENDKNLLLSNYIETPEFRSILETKDSTVVVGRRGTGKSAMYLRLAKFWKEEKNNYVIQVAPEDYQTIGFRSLFKIFDAKYSHVRAAARIIWKYGFLLEILSHISRNYKLKESFSCCPAAVEHVKKWSSSSADFLSTLSNILRVILKSVDDPDEAISTLSFDLKIADLERDLENLLSKSNVNFYILIDRLDEGYENDETGAAIIAGLIAVVSEINKRYSNIRPVLFQRDNIIRSVAKYDPDYTRNIEGEVIRIHWDTHQLLKLVTKRLDAAFNLQIENSQKIWDRCTADEGADRELQGQLGFKKCLQFTLYRPRDLLSLLNQSFFEAGKQDRNKIVLSDVEKTAKYISENRLDDLKKEYQSIIPVISCAVSVFSNGSPEMTYLEAIEKIDALSITIQNDSSAEAQQDYRILGSDGVLRALYSVGFLGTHDESSGSFNFCHDGRNPDREFSSEDKILLHPCYWIGLNLSKNALSPEDAEQINDEYEINVTSVTPEIRVQKIGTLISEIGSIKTGREDASSFEQWVTRALQTIFAGHLSNIVPHPNGSAVQRRDIVGTNLIKTPTWQHIHNTYEVHQVVFDAKNFSELSIDAYRQLSTYLTGPYGRLGFIVSRNEEETIKVGAELDWVREIYYTQNKLIIRITYKTLTRLLSKLRNPEKHDAVEQILSNMLDLYERNYLSLQTTRSKSKKRHS